jgi:GNAT superfamily N-acetyltransferase
VSLAGLLPLPGAVVSRGHVSDVAEIYVLQRCCWVVEAIANDALAIPALHETHDDIAGWVSRTQVQVVRLDGRLVGAVRGHQVGELWEIGRLMVAPDLSGRGIGRWLLAHIEALAPPTVTRFGLFTGRRSERNLRMYGRAGYQLTDAPEGSSARHISSAVFLAKPAVG